MSRIILLDSGPLGLITNPSASEENRECNAWIQTRLREGDRVMVPAISDYEIRRELLRADCPTHADAGPNTEGAISRGPEIGPPKPRPHNQQKAS